MLAHDPWLAHSTLSAAYNLGLLDPAEAVARVEAAWREGSVPLPSAVGYVRQVIGWREYMWHLYWHFGDDYRNANALDHHEPVPAWFDDLDAGATRGRCGGPWAQPGRSSDGASPCATSAGTSGTTPATPTRTTATSRCARGSATWTPARHGRAACPTSSTASTGAAGCTTSRGSWCSA